MNPLTRGSTRADLLALGTLAGLGLAFALPTLALCQEKDHRSRCTNNLRQIGMAAAQYADDKGVFPHIGAKSTLDREGKTAPAKNDVPPRCLRSLIYFAYLDDPALFVCPASNDKPTIEVSPKTDLHTCGWGGRKVDGVPPLVKPAAGDEDADALTDLSYGWTVRGLDSRSSPKSLLAADRARRVPGATVQKIAGNHEDGWAALQLDLHTSWVDAGSQAAHELADTSERGGALVVWDDAIAGVPKPPALSAKLIQAAWQLVQIRDAQESYRRQANAYAASLELLAKGGHIPADLAKPAPDSVRFSVELSADEFTTRARSESDASTVLSLSKGEASVTLDRGGVKTRLRATQIRLEAKADWSDTGLTLESGDTALIAATGEWTIDGSRCGPSGRETSAHEERLLADRLLGCLCARVAGDALPVGQGPDAVLAFEATRKGSLQVRTSSKELTRNSGALEVFAVQLVR